VVLHDHEGEDQQNLHAVYEPTEFIGESSGGNWVLFILDAGPQDVGRLNSWTLTLDLAGDPPCVTDADCDLPQVQTNACNAGRCEIVSCDPGWSNCNDYRLDGCETGTDSDLQNCGRCGEICANPPRATAACVLGVCTVGSCIDPFDDCDGEFENGCETNLEGDATRCGSCEIACDFENAGSVCQAGQCVMGACRAPFGDCDNDPQNGCETNLDEDNQHCGGCGRACSLPGGSASCRLGECTLDACDPGLADCNQSPQDGCETDLQANGLHCGSCENACPPESRCEAGACREVQEPDGNGGDGCGCAHATGSRQGCALVLMALGLLVLRRRREAG
jgi:MYXO-CTERM domain-containing protein